ncbi:MAG: hypothetical protein ACLFUJ_12580 [Phycisphaerae bacterium]
MHAGDFLLGRDIGPHRALRWWNLLLPAIAGSLEAVAVGWLLSDPHPPAAARWMLPALASGSFALLVVLGLLFELLWPGRPLTLPLLSANLGNLAVQSSLVVVLKMIRTWYGQPDALWTAVFLLSAGLACIALLLPLSWAIQVIRSETRRVHHGYGVDVEIRRW